MVFFFFKYILVQLCFFARTVGDIVEGNYNNNYYEYIYNHIIIYSDLFVCIYRIDVDGKEKYTKYGWIKFITDKVRCCIVLQ